MKSISSHSFIKSVLYAITLVLAVNYAWTLYGRPLGGVDDANIFFVYAEHVAQGAGFVFNLGGERVEGFTSPLWVVLCAASFGVGLDEMGMAWLSMVLLLLTQLVFLKLARSSSTARDQAGFPLQLIYGLLVVSMPGYLVWNSFTLMDTVLWGFCLAVCVHALVCPPKTVAGKGMTLAFICFLPLVRPEALMVSPAFILLSGLKTIPEGWAVAGKKVLVHMLVFLAVIGFFTACRMAYFGYPLPNTYYAKVSPSPIYRLREGLDYLHAYITSSPVVFAGFYCCLGWCLRSAVRVLDGRNWQKFSFTLSGFAVRWSDAEILALAACVLIAAPVISGGDHFSMHRFFQPVYPIFCLVLTLFVARGACAFLPGPQRPGAKKTLAVGLLAVGCIGLWSHAADVSWRTLRWNRPLQHEFVIAENGRRRGRELNDLFAGEVSYPAVGAIMVGGIKRTYTGDIIDLMGLNNIAMGHAPGDRRGIKNHAAFNPEVFFRLAPDILLTYLPRRSDDEDWTVEALKGMLGTVRFHSKYTYGRLSRPTNTDSRSLTAFFNKKYLEGLEASQWRFAEDKRWIADWVGRP